MYPRKVRHISPRSSHSHLREQVRADVQCQRSFTKARLRERSRLGSSLRLLEANEQRLRRVGVGVQTSTEPTCRCSLVACVTL